MTKKYENYLKCKELIYSCSIITVKPRKFEFDFSKYSLIRNKFGTHLIQKLGPIHNLF